MRADWLAEEPDLAEHEARVLDLLAGAALMTPELVAVDATGEHGGAPAVLMTRLPGRIDWRPLDIEPYLLRLAEALAPIHAMTISRGTAIRPYRPYDVDTLLRPPPWTQDSAAWERAIQVHHGEPPVIGTCSIHRDYHPGNVLGVRGAVSGVVDWVNASIGAPEADVATAASTWPGTSVERRPTGSSPCGRRWGQDRLHPLLGPGGGSGRSGYEEAPDTSLDALVLRAVGALQGVALRHDARPHGQ